LSVAAAIVSWLGIQAFGAGVEEFEAVGVLLPTELDVPELVPLEFDPLLGWDGAIEVTAVALSPLLLWNAIA
jgi:hypothetical protein